MTTFQMQNTVHLEQVRTDLDDPMELSGDADRQPDHGDDLDLDLDVPDQQTNNEEDDYMSDEEGVQEGGKFEQNEGGAIANDDDMADDNDPDEELLDANSVEDEEIGDAEVEEPVELDVPRDTNQASIFSLAEPHAEEEGFSAEHPDIEGQVALDSSHDEATQENTGREADLSTADNQNNLGPPQQTGNTETGLDEHQPDMQEDPQKHNEISHESTELVDPPVENVTAQEAENHPEGHWNSEELETLNGLQKNDGADAARNGAEASVATERRSYAHPIVVNYQGAEMSLFPPTHEGQEHSGTYFLQDEVLVGESMTSVLSACRSVLAESIGEQDELVLSIDDLNINIAETSTDAVHITLNQILDVYVQLQHQDGHSDPPPLYTTLYTNTKSSSRLEYLQCIVADGRGLSSIMPLESETDNVHSGTHAEATSQSTAVSQLAVSPEEEAVSESQKAASLPEKQAASTNTLHNEEQGHQQESNLSVESASDSALQPKSNQAYEDNGVQPDKIESKQPEIANEFESRTSDTVGEPEISSAPEVLTEHSEEKTFESTKEDLDEDDLPYEDEEPEQGQDSSAGSSTLQGDGVNEAKPEQLGPPAESARNREDEFDTAEEAASAIAQEYNFNEVHPEEGEIVNTFEEDTEQFQEANFNEGDTWIDQKLHEEQIALDISDMTAPSELRPSGAADSNVSQNRLQDQPSDSPNESPDALQDDLQGRDGNGEFVTGPQAVNANDSTFNDENDPDGIFQDDNGLENLQEEGLDLPNENRPTDQTPAQELNEGDSLSAIRHPEAQKGDSPAPEGLSANPDLSYEEEIDEITYLDEDDTHAHWQKQETGASSPSSLKRRRSHPPDEEAAADDLQGSKRVRSS